LDLSLSLLNKEIADLPIINVLIIRMGTHNLSLNEDESFPTANSASVSLVSNDYFLSLTDVWGSHFDQHYSHNGGYVANHEEFCAAICLLVAMENNYTCDFFFLDDSGRCRLGSLNEFDGQNSGEDFSTSSYTIYFLKSEQKISQKYQLY